MTASQILAFWRERFGSIVRLSLLLPWVGMQHLYHLVEKPTERITGGSIVVPMLILGAALMRRDGIGGAAPAASPPESRIDDIGVRWMGLASAGFAVGLVLWLVWLPFGAPAGGRAWFLALASLLEVAFTAVGLAAVMSGVSSRVPGIMDAVLVLGLAVGGWAVDFAGGVAGRDALQRFGYEIHETMIPRLPLSRMLEHGHSFYPMFTWASSTMLGLLVAVGSTGADFGRVPASGNAGNSQATPRQLRMVVLLLLVARLVVGVGEPLWFDYLFGGHGPAPAGSIGSSTLTPPEPSAPR
jgi:hypothetical protein